MSRVVNDSSAVSSLVTTHAKGLFSGALLLLGSALVLISLDVWLTAVIFLTIIVAFAIMAPIFATLSAITRAINDRTAELSSLLARVFSEIRLVKSCTAEDFESRRIGGAIHDVYSSTLASNKVQAVLAPITSIALTVAVLAIFLYGGARVALGTLTVGTLTAFILYIFNIVAPLLQLSAFISAFQAARGSSGRIADIFGEDPQTLSIADATSDEVKTSNGLVFYEVSLAYRNSSRLALNIPRLVIPKGKSTAIIGPSGAGKSSIISLIERFYEPTSGNIYWDGVSIDDVPVSEWRGKIGYVAQTAPVMYGTIGDNIAYGLPVAFDQRQTENAAEAANCLSFVQALDLGFDSQVGDSGVMLSGGQRQRIAIARVFMRDPEILLLDEPTSNLDIESEGAVLNALRRLMIGRTTIIVTHRLSGLADVDYIAVMEAGEIIDFGERDKIVKESAYYKRMAPELL